MNGNPIGRGEVCCAHGNRRDRLFLPLGHCGSEDVTKFFFWIKARIEGLVRSFEEVNQKHHLPIFHLPDSHFDF